MTEVRASGRPQSDEEAGRRAAARSRAYRLFAEAFEYPDPELVELIRSRALSGALREALQGVDPKLAEELDGSALAETGASDELAVEYTRLFDVGVGGPPCPLYGGLYGGDRMKTMEEVVRFYNHFGLTLDEARRELPDHLTTELEFLHFLCFREADALRRGLDAGPFRRAERDFLERHPARWLPRLAERLARHEPPVYYQGLVAALLRFLERDREQLHQVLAASAPS